MSALLEGVNKRTQLVGQNRLELLLFRLHGDQRFGINVFKVREVVLCPRLTLVPSAHPLVCGVARLRGQTIPVIDLDLALGGGGVADRATSFVIITEFNSSVQGFLVGGVDAIVNVNWEDMKAPPRSIERVSYLTSVTSVEDRLVEVIDVERVLAEIRGRDADAEVTAAGIARYVGPPVLVVDDSAVARNQIQRALDQVGVPSVIVNNGREALELLLGWANEDAVPARVALVISDIEMPEKDGYTLTQDIRQDSRLAHLHVILHSSLSGGFNHAMVEQAGADRFLSKFKADDLVQAVLSQIQA